MQRVAKARKLVSFVPDAEIEKEELLCLSFLPPSFIIFLLSFIINKAGDFNAPKVEHFMFR